MANLISNFVFLLMLCILPYSCGRKGDPLPRSRARPATCLVRWASHRILEVKLPTKDEYGHSLIGIDKVRIYHLPLQYDRPTGDLVITKGQVVIERNLLTVTKIEGLIKLDLRQLSLPMGWLVVVAVRVGGVTGVSSETLIWLDSSM